MTLPPLFTAALYRVHRRCRLELAVLAAVLCDPAAGVAHARAVGVGEEVFDQDDTRCIFLACEGRANTADAVAAARMRLIAERLWDPQSPRQCRGAKWSLPSLAALACQFHGGPCVIQRREIESRGRELLAAHAELRDAAAHLERACVLVGMAPDEARWHPVSAARETVRLSRNSGIPVRMLLEHIDERYMDAGEAAA